MKKLKLLFIFCIFCLMGCATTSYSPTAIKTENNTPGIYHRIQRGETLWRISKKYNVDLEEISRINHISDATSIDVGRVLFIPQPTNQMPLSETPYSSDEFIWPITGRVIASFGEIINNLKNKGINIQPSGNSDIVATRSGRVVFYVDNFKGFGKTVIIDHNDGFLSVYARNSQVFIKVGDMIKKGDLIAKAGSAGRDKNIYLHFEIRKGSIAQNPIFYLAN
jgi:murein DD-endopeptidase MepM/ murein hydrolase activator NlpD